MTSVPHSGAKSVTPGGSVAGGHSAGPWFEQPGFSDDVEITSASRAGKVSICAMDVDYTGQVGVEQRANARLIAAAPDLLSVARLALKTILDAAEARDFEPPADPILIAELEAAIAKATADETRNAEPIQSEGAR